MMKAATPGLIFLLLLLFFRYHPDSIHFEKTDDIDSLSLYKTAIEEVETWRPMHDAYTQEEIASAKDILNREFNIKQEDSSPAKMMKISSRLIQVLRALPGNPGPEVFRLTPLALYEQCKQKKVQVYCTQYTLLFTYFCKMAGLVVRPIESFGVNDRHSTYECYLPEEKRWVWSDLLNNIIYLEDERGKLNLLQMLSYLHTNRMIDINVIGLDDSLNRSVRLGKAVEQPLRFDFDSNCVFHFYHETNLDWVYSKQQRWIRFLGDKTWFSRYAPKKESNIGYYLKYPCFLLFLLSGLYGSILLFKKRNPGNS